ncbi:hypothetical protein P4O66_014014, partial [Electrophorus voltai]
MGSRHWGWGVTGGKGGDCSTGSFLCLALTQRWRASQCRHVARCSKKDEGRSEDEGSKDRICTAVFSTLAFRPHLLTTPLLHGQQDWHNDT